ncbi:hypothetical protein CK203_104526 [Vitis vinifera]|uniref:Uncharacterized protein n=1 Tax=Vitis vinifera TaxID=29760 RepID=A0A438D3S8_VITVI|nr:hypothetical protein CK203_104526 [Vitis vinifera]
MMMMVPQVLELVGVQVGCGTSGGSGGGGGTGKSTGGGGGVGGDYVSQADPDMSWV